MTDPYDVDSDGDDPEVAIVEWTWGKAPVQATELPWRAKTVPATEANYATLRKFISVVVCILSMGERIRKYL